MEFHRFLESYGWLVAIGFLLVGAIVLHILIHFIGRALYRKLSGRVAARRLIVAFASKAAILPLTSLVWVLVVIFSLEIAFRQWLEFDHPLPLIRAQQYAVIAAVVWWVFRWKRMAQNRLNSHAQSGRLALDVAQIDLVGKLISVILFLFTVLLVMQVAGLDMKAISTVGGFSALAIGLAGKEVFANLFSGIMIYITKPFAIGDIISSPGKGIEGVVEKIGWYLTQVRAVNKQPAYVPNSLFSTAVVTNTSRMTNRRIEFKLGLRYNDLLMVPPIVQEVRSLLEAMEAIDQKLSPSVWFTDYGSSSVNIFVRAYTVSTGWFNFLEIQQEVLLACGEIVRRHEAEFAFPTTTLDFPSDFHLGLKD